MKKEGVIHSTLTQKEGIYICGTMQSPMGIDDALIQACSAASHCGELLSLVREKETVNLRNHCTWVHVLLEVARVLGTPQEELLTPEELAVLDGKSSPEGVIF